MLCAQVACGWDEVVYSVVVVGDSGIERKF